MLRRTYDDQVCSAARTLELIGERWTLLIVRDALRGVTRFDGFLARLSIARNVLADRLNTLVDNGIFERVRYLRRPERFEYRLTTRGRELLPVIVTLTEWGDRHLADEHGPPIEFAHSRCSGRVVSRLCCRSCDRPVPVADVTSRRPDRRNPEDEAGDRGGSGRATRSSEPSPTDRRPPAFDALLEPVSR